MNRATVLESYGSAITQALRRLDRVTTVARTAVSLAEATDEEWQLANQAIGIGRGWDVAYRLVSTVDLPGKEFPATEHPEGPRHAGMSGGPRDADAVGRSPDPEGVGRAGPRNAGQTGGVPSEVDGRVRPSLRPRDSPSARGPGSQQRVARVAAPGGGISWPPGP